MTKFYYLSKRATLAMAIVFQTVSLSAQSIWTNPITGNSPALSNPYTTGDVADPNITVSGIGKGSGVNARKIANSYGTDSWDNAALDSTTYLTFTLSPNAAYEIDFSDLTLAISLDMASPSDVVLRSSLDNFSTDIQAFMFPSVPPFVSISVGITVSLSAPSFQNITSPIEFRLYGWGASSPFGRFDIEDFTFNGTVSPATPTLITFEEYKAVKKENASYLSWKLGGTDEGEKIGIQHSTDGNRFTTLAVVDQETSSFVHERPSKGANYYRLQSIAVDGKKSYSKTHVLVFNNREETILYPNPAAQEIHIATNNASTIKSVTIHNVTGAMMIRSSNEAIINTAGLANGIYTATVTLTDGNVEQHRFTIMK